MKCRSGQGLGFSGGPNLSSFTGKNINEQMPKNGLNRLGSWDWVPIFLFCVVLASRFYTGAHPVDDAYITFRYSENLLAGKGLVYNPGEAVLGTSAPLYALLLALFGRISGIAIPVVSLWVNAVFDGVTAVLIFKLGQGLGGKRSIMFLMSLCWSLSPLVFRYSVGGMETSMVTGLILLSAFLNFHGRDSLALKLSGLAVLGRLDALAAFVPLWIGSFRSRKLNPMLTGFLVAVFLFVCALASLAFYGSLLPQSVLAKSTSVYQPDPVINILQIVYFLGGVFLAGPLNLFARGNYYWPETYLESIALYLAAALFLIIVFRIRKRLAERSSWWTTWLSYPALFILTYLVFGFRGSSVAEWYLVQLSPYPFLLIGMALDLVQAKRKWNSLAILSLAALLLLVQISGFRVRSLGTGYKFAPVSIWVERERLYEEAASYLRAQPNSVGTVAAPEIGALGYYCDCVILDTVGLISPVSVSYYPLPLEDLEINNSVPEDLIRDLNPEYVVALDVFINRTLLDSRWFEVSYGLVWSKDAQVFGSEQLLIFRSLR